MNQISVFGNVMSKVDFFDYVYDTFVDADFTEPESVLNQVLNILYGILDCFNWTAEYKQWVADGAGANEASASLDETLKAFPVA